MFDESDLIYRYTRAQAIGDGVLVDVSVPARKRGFTVSVCLTARAWSELVAWDAHDSARMPGLGQSEDGRLHDVLVCAHRAAKGAGEGADRVDLEVWRVDRRGGKSAPQKVQVWMHIGPGDNGEPVLTILMPGDD